MRTNFVATLLVVEDSESSAALISEKLENFVTTVRTTRSGTEAIEILCNDPVDLVLLDHRLPDMTGIEVIRSLAEKGIYVPFVTITGNGDEKIAVEMMKLGAYDYLIKDEHFHKLLPTVVGRVLGQLATEVRLKTAEEKLFTEELRYRELFEHMSSGVAVMGPCEEGGDFVLLDYNQAAIRICGLEDKRMAGRRVKEVFTGMPAHCMEGIQQVWKTGESRKLPEFYYHDGRVSGWRQCYVYRLPSREIVVIFDDITKEKEAEDALRAEERKYRELYNEFHTLLNGIPDGLVLLDRRLQVVWCNDSFADLAGRNVEEVKGLHCHEAWHGMKAHCHDCPVVQCFVIGRVVDTLHRVGNRIYGMKAFPVKNEAGETVNVFKLCADVTERVRLREEAGRASRLASLGELAAGMAHEINNPNALILLNSPLLQEMWSAAAPVLDHHYKQEGDFLMGGMLYSRVRNEVPRLQAEIGESAKRIKTIVEDLKHFVRQGEDDIHDSLDLNAVAGKAVRLAENTIKKATRRFHADYGEDLPMIRGHFGRLEQVVVNLLLNACQALPSPDREIVLKTRHDPEKGSVILEVRDQGSGIAPEDMPRLTDPFFTTRRESGGTGLGLSVSARIAKEHGARLRFDSEPGEGTAVSLVMPVPGSTDADENPLPSLAPAG